MQLEHPLHVLVYISDEIGEVWAAEDGRPRTWWLFPVNLVEFLVVHLAL